MEKKQLFKRTSTPGNSANYTPMESFAIVVDEYDLESANHAVIGTRIDTGDQVRVTLNALSDEEKAKFAKPRSEIKTLAAPRKFKNDPGTTVGGTLLIENARIDKEAKEYSARWIRSLSHEPGEGYVLTGRAYLSAPREGKNNSKNMMLTVLCDGNVSNLPEDVLSTIRYNPPFEIEYSDLEATVTEMLQENMGVGLRIRTDDGFDGTYVRPNGKTNATELSAGFIKGLGEDLAAACNSGTAKLEIIPIMTMFLGKDTVATYEANKSRIAELARFNRGVTGEGAQQRVAEVVFSPVYIALRSPEPGKSYVTSVIHQNPPFADNEIKGDYRSALSNAIAYAQTEFFAPDISEFNTSSKEESDDMDFGGDVDDANLMSAVSGQEDSDVRSVPKM